jgi:hypothetical protein
MGLPVLPTRSEVVEVDGQEVKIRGLTRHEAFLVQRLTGDGDIEGAEVQILAAGTDTPPDEVRAWYQGASNDSVGVIVDAVVRLSGIGEEARKSSGAQVPAG